MHIEILRVLHCVQIKMETLPVDLACRVRAAVASSAVSGRLAHLLCHPQGRLASHAMTKEECAEERAEEQVLEQLGAKLQVVLCELYCKHGDRGRRKALAVVREVSAKYRESRKGRKLNEGWEEAVATNQATAALDPQP